MIIIPEMNIHPFSVKMTNTPAIMRPYVPIYIMVVISQDISSLTRGHVASEVRML